jgi:uncharacterized protein with von Willebrand factor type A (vWA) domain
MYIFSKMDNNIDEIINENETLKQRVNELEERLKKYTSGKNHKKYYEKNKENPKKERKYDEMRLVHGLLRCKSGCGSWNRDRNGASNIYKIAYQAIHNLERPSYLCRETNCDIKSKSLGVQFTRKSGN